MAGGSKSKRKGNEGERALAKILSSVFGGSFVRVPNSGAMLGKSNAFRKATLSVSQNLINRGDIIPPDFLKHFYIECKAYAAFPFHALMTTGPVPLLDHWLEQVYAGIEEDDVFFIGFKIRRRGWFVVVLDEGYQKHNHCIYENEQGRFLITELQPFMVANRELIMERCRAGQDGIGSPRVDSA